MNNNNNCIPENPTHNSGVFAVGVDGNCAPIQEQNQAQPQAPTQTQVSYGSPSSGVYAQPEPSNSGFPDAYPDNASNVRQIPADQPVYQQPAPTQAAYTAPTYATAQTPSPAPRSRALPKITSAAVARILLWVVGVIVGVTLLFGCLLFWVYGVNWLDRALSGEAFGDNQTQTNDEDNFPADDDFFFYFPNGNSNGSNGDSSGSSNGSSDSQQQSSNAGLGIEVTAFQPELGINDTYSQGLLIVSINDDSAFIGTDVQVNDMIVAAEGNITADIDTLKSMLAQKKVGDDFTLTIARYASGVARTFDVTVSLVSIE